MFTTQENGTLILAKIHSKIIRESWCKLKMHDCWLYCTCTIMRAHRNCEARILDFNICDFIHFWYRHRRHRCAVVHTNGSNVFLKDLCHFYRDKCKNERLHSRSCSRSRSLFRWKYINQNIISTFILFAGFLFAIMHIVQHSEDSTLNHQHDEDRKFQRKMSTSKPNDECQRLKIEHTFGCCFFFRLC